MRRIFAKKLRLLSALLSGTTTVGRLSERRKRSSRFAAPGKPGGFDYDRQKVYDQSLVQDIYEVATRDPLTCLPGRKYMESCIGEELERFRRTGHPFAILFADANRFHDINNAYGHATGDALLRIIGLDLRRYGRRADRFCRWGGDEFVGILQLRDPSEVEQAAERFQKLAAEEKIAVDGVSVSIQAAIGITVVREGDDLKSLVSRADRYMYLAKVRAGNLIVTDASADQADARGAEETAKQ